MQQIERIPCDYIDRGKAHGLVEHLIRAGAEERAYTWTLREDHVLVRRSGEQKVSHLMGQRVNYCIDALASRTTQDRSTGARRRTYVTSMADRREWIMRQLFERSGLMPVTPVQIGGVIAPTVHTKGSAFKKPGARYSGTALVVDPALLAQALNTGIGDGKAYGFGMLIIEEED